MKNIFYRIESSWIWVWVKKNANALVALCAVIGLVVSVFVTFVPRNEKVYTSGRPNIKIKSVRLKTFPYEESTGSQSIALKFYITIKNDGSTAAHDVKIIKKEIDLVRGHFDLKEISLQSIYTSSSFDLKPKEIIEDNIFIDESPSNMEKVLKGSEKFILKYEIHFYADKTLQNEPYIYQYESKFSNGEFQVISESLRQDIK